MSEIKRTYARNLVVRRPPVDWEVVEAYNDREPVVRVTAPTKELAVEEYAASCIMPDQDYVIREGDGVAIRRAGSNDRWEIYEPRWVWVQATWEPSNGYDDELEHARKQGDITDEGA